MSVLARWRQVAYSPERDLSARRACTLLSALSYQSQRAAQGALVIERMKTLAAQYPRYGYRRIRIFLERDGYRIIRGRTYRLWPHLYAPNRAIVSLVKEMNLFDSTTKP